MESEQQEFLFDLLDTASPSGFELPVQEAWGAYVDEYADDLRLDAYGNVIATYDGGEGATVAFTGHADEIGYIVTDVDGGGFLHIAPIGGADPTVSRGQHVVVHAGDEAVNGVIGQTPVHLRETGTPEYDDVTQQVVDVGARDAAAARERVAVGDPVTVASGARELADGRIAGRGLDNRVGAWTAAVGFQRAVERGADSTVHAVSTVQEEVGFRGARMVGDALEADAVVAVDLTSASDTPTFPADRHNAVALGDGPVVMRGSVNHRSVIRAVREAAERIGVDVQRQAAGDATGTDADVFYVDHGGRPTMNLGIPSRHMHTPVEMVDLRDLDAAADLLAAVAEDAAERDDFELDR